MKLSFLDLVFGALGAVLLLFCILLSMSGAPLQKGTPLNRTIVWEFTYPEEIPSDLQAEILYCPVEIHDLNDEIELEPILEGKTLNCVSPDGQPIHTEIGNVTVMRRPAPDRKNPGVNNNIITVYMEVTMGDDGWTGWIDSLTLSFNSRQWKSSKVTITPSGKESEKEFDYSDFVNEQDSNDGSNDVYILCKSKLIDEDGGLLPFIEAYQPVKRKMNN